MIWLHIAALWAIAVAQPLFDLLAANPEFFVAHRAAGALEVLVLTLTLAAVLPSLLVLSVRLIGLAGPRARGSALNVVRAGLVCVLAMQLAVRVGTSTWFMAIPISVAISVAVVLAYRRWAPVRTFFSVLSIAAVVVPAVFLLKPEIRSLVAGQADDPGNTEASATASGTSITTPIVLIIFDEMPLVSLLDANRNIDPLLYPNFSALAGDGIWFRNATTVDDFTKYAVPAIVSGKYPLHPALPSAAHHPNTLFTLLSRTHRLEVSEIVTSLCPQRLCPVSVETSLSQRLVAMARDLRVVFLHLILTSDLTRGLPDPTETWAGFGGGDASSDTGDGDDARTADDSDSRAVADAARQRWRQGVETPRVNPVRQFIDGIGKDDPQPTFYFIHTLISHQPHRMLPTGKLNKTWVNSLPGKQGWNKDEPWAVGQRQQRHLLQVGFVDNLVGQIVKRLKDAGVYERALIVITSDHGISYLLNAPQRNFTRKIAPEIMRIPLIVKFPERIKVESHISDANVESVDIVPTIADVLKIELPWKADGISVLNPSRPERVSKAIFTGSKRRRQNIDAGGLDIEPALRKFDLFGDGTANKHRAPHLPGFDGLVGQPLTSLRVVQGADHIEIANAFEYEHVDLAEPAVVFDVAGRFASPRPDAKLAIAVNGVVEAVTRTWESNARGWLATPRLGVWRQGRNSVEVFVIDRDASGVLLRRAIVGHVRPPGLNLISAAAVDEWGVEQGGFYQIERSGTAILRWTRGRAVLSNLFTHDPPREVQVEVLIVPGGKAKPLKIEANDLYSLMASSAAGGRPRYRSNAATYPETGSRSRSPLMHRATPRMAAASASHCRGSSCGE